ncbi:MAG TPA: thioredoxin domain-containing protein, partial [Gemmatimonadaceae bacterium]
ISSWEEAFTAGTRVGDEAAAVTIVVLSDLECPACRAFESTLHEVLGDHDADVSTVYVPFPLPMHRFALGAARGAECANAVGKFREWLSVVYQGQDSLGLKSWGAYAASAGIADTAAISRCAADPAPVPRIEAGREFAQRIGATGTPTILVNGWRLPAPPTAGELHRVVDAFKRGKVPFVAD